MTELEPETRDSFPESFFWGSATASYQVEGGIENNDWAEAARLGKVPVCGKATDHYHRFEEDFDLAKELSHNAHRFSIEWSRIEPQEGVFNEEEIEHYKQVVRSLKKRGIEPFVTLWHFTLPNWFVEKGGFFNPDAPQIFGRYCEKVVASLKEDVSFWMTMNEPLVWASGGYRTGKWPPFKKSFILFHQVQSWLIKAHISAYKAIKKSSPKVSIGIAKHNIYFSSDSWWGVFPRLIANWYWNERFLNKIRVFQDFIGLNQYFHKNFGTKKKFPQSDMGWDIYGQGLYGTLVALRKYKIPVYITESGLADRKDIYRASFLREYIQAALRALQAGVMLRGYFYWSLLDNYEWSFGFTEQFGLIEVNYDTQERTVRKSAFVYKDIIDRNSL